jgi:hypothetical protein
MYGDSPTEPLWRLHLGNQSKLVPHLVGGVAVTC